MKSFNALILDIIFNFSKNALFLMAFLNEMRRTLMQGMCNKQVTSAKPLSHHLSSKDSKTRSIFSHSQLQYKLNGLINDSYYITLPINSHAEVTVVLSSLILV